MYIYNLGVQQLHEKLTNKELSSVEITKAFLEHIKEVESKVQAFVTVCEKEALEQAKKVDEKIQKGETIAPLAGIPGGIKDNICTKGIKTTCSSRMLENFIPPYDASIIEKLKSQDALFIGKTNLDEFAMGMTTETSYFKSTKNPWSLDCVPGGSSGGSVSAVAAGQVAWALGSDTGGSIRQPAAFTGVVGMKPTYGRVSRSGCVPLASSLDQFGPITKNVTDCAHVLNAISGHCPFDANSYQGETPDFTKSLVADVKGMKIGLPKEYFSLYVDKTVKEKVLQAIKQLESLGAQIVEISLPHTDYSATTYSVIASAETASNMSRLDGVKYGYRSPNAKNINDLYVKSRSEGFGKEVKLRVTLGNYFLSADCYEEYYLHAMKIRTLIVNDFQKAFEKVDVIASPAATTTAFKIGANLPKEELYMSSVLHIPANMAGLPAISIPCGFVENMPVGLQIIGNLLDDSNVIKAAYTYEQNTDFHKQIAPVGGK